MENVRTLCFQNHKARLCLKKIGGEQTINLRGDKNIKELLTNISAEGSSLEQSTAAARGGGFWSRILERKNKRDMTAKRS
ncbi:MAG: hypothetical protein ISP24_03985 [Rickettsiales bacterium]|nr:hypothetical protein [Rickettsiales bacterium]